MSGPHTSTTGLDLRLEHGARGGRLAPRRVVRPGAAQLPRRPLRLGLGLGLGSQSGSVWLLACGWDLVCLVSSHLISVSPCRHVLSNVSRVAARDSSRTLATVQDLFIALGEDDAIYGMFKSMKGESCFCCRMDPSTSTTSCFPNAPIQVIIIVLGDPPVTHAPTPRRPLGGARCSQAPG